MKQIVGLAFFMFVIALGWRLGSRLSSDAVSMAVGILLGVMASLPAALLVMASSRRQTQPKPGGPPMPQTSPYGAQPPVIVVTGQTGAAPHQLHTPAEFARGHETGWPGHFPHTDREARTFHIVGETADWVDEWE